MLLTLGGDFESHQTVPGQLADFNMWKREMNLDELNILTCGTEGDVVSWNTLQEKGASSRAKKNFPACKSKQMLKLLKKSVFSYNFNT